jgi:uncharacterized protein (DUF58 family)
VPVPTRRLAVLAAALSLVVLALPLGLPESVLVVDGALLAVAAVDWWRAARPADLEVVRDLPGALVLGGEGEVTWRVRNPTARRLVVALADDLAPSLGATRRARLVLPPRAVGRASSPLRPRRRGRFDVREVVLRVDGPLGLAARQGAVPLPGVLRVAPAFRSREEAELRLRRARLLEVGLRSAVGRGGGTEFDALRPYTPDDETRRIDWAATARSGTGDAVVRTYRAERNQSVLCLLDLGRTMAAQVGGVPRLEHAMDAVLALTSVCTGLGDRAGLLAFSSDVRAVVAPGAGGRRLGRVTEVLSTLEPELVESDYRGAFLEALTRSRRRALLVLLTELAEQALTDTLLPALPLLVRDHVVVVAGVTDPDVARWARGSPSEAGTAYRKAAAVAALEERARVVARLRGLGATVVDEPPGRLAPALCDAYLRVKATGRL